MINHIWKQLKKPAVPGLADPIWAPFMAVGIILIGVVIANLFPGLFDWIIRTLHWAK